MLSTAEQRQRQFQWRSWEAMLRSLPLEHTNVTLDGARTLRTLDLGCGTGDMVRLQRETFGWDARGMDSDPRMLNAADPDKVRPFLLQGDVTTVALPQTFDVLWSSFTVQYFLDDFAVEILPRWLDLLKPGGLMAIVETDGLFEIHGPLPAETKKALQAMEQSLMEQGGYHTRAGSKLPGILEQCPSVEILSDTQWEDPELAFSGKASEEILEAWRGRIGRMKFFEMDRSRDWTPHLQTFLDCLSRDDHFTETKLRLIVARKRQ